MGGSWRNDGGAEAGQGVSACQGACTLPYPLPDGEIRL